MLQLVPPRAEQEARGEPWQQGQHFAAHHHSRDFHPLFQFFFLYLFILFPLFSIAPSRKRVICGAATVQHSPARHSCDCSALQSPALRQPYLLQEAEQPRPDLGRLKADFNLSALLSFHSMNTYFSCSALVEIGSDLVIGISTGFSSLLQKGNHFNSS